LVEEAVVAGRLRELVEWYSALRPELVDGLYKSDVQWPTVGRAHAMQREFNVTCNGSFFRPEVLAMVEEVRRYKQPFSDYTVFVPCAADKPYPAPLHQAVAQWAPNAYLVVATGVVGVIPSELWGVAPLYDSGIPNKLRVRETVANYARVNLSRLGGVIIYSDFYGEDVAAGLDEAGVPYVWPVRTAVLRTRDAAARPEHAVPEYINLLDPGNLGWLARALGQVQ
jgi:hypothetical protein